MSKQRYVQDSFWTDPYIEKLTPDEKLVFIYLLTNPQSNIAGVYEIRPKRIAYETGYDVEVIETILKRFVKDEKIIRVNDWVWLVNHAKHQASNPAVEKGRLRIYADLPDEVQIAIRGYTKKKIPKRKSNVTSSRKDKVKERDSFKCVLCGSTTDLHVDHIKPVFMGGSDQIENLRTLCRSCNLSRNNTDYDIYSIGSDSLSEDVQTSVKLSKVKLSNNIIVSKKEKPDLIVFGEFKNVKLSEEEHNKLIERFGKESTDDLIEELAGYIASTNKKYASHYATILNWARRKTTERNYKKKNITII